jgi:phytoene dehydrogenase-like protein
MAEKSVIIIGAGLAGLATGCYCRMNGYATHIFEHHTVPGGVAATWRRGEYTVEGGIHFLMGHRPGTATYGLYEELGATRGQAFLDMEDYAAYTSEADGREVRVTGDLDATFTALRALSPADGAVLHDLQAHALQVAGIGLDSFDMARPHELGGGGLDNLKSLWHMRHQLKHFTGHNARPVAQVAKDIHDPFLRWVVENLFLPEVPVWFVSMLLGLLSGRQIGLLSEGSLSFARSIEQRYLDLDGTVDYRSTVAEILVEHDRAVGVRLLDGTEHRADVVVSAADGYTTIFGMLGGRYVSDKIRNRYRKWPLFRPTMIVSYGVGRTFPDEAVLTMVQLETPMLVGSYAAPGYYIRTFNYSDSFAPPGKTVVQVQVETDWDTWHDLRRADRPQYDSKKVDVAAEILRHLERRWPGFSSQVDMTDVATPYTTWRYTGNHRGSYEGWLPTSENIMTVMERSLPGLDDFYMAGQWVIPGGGVPPALYSGRHVAQILCKRDGKEFVATTPA